MAIKEKKIKASVTISRPQGHDGDHISIKIRDESSRTEFLSIRMGLADFAEALTGLSEVKADATVRQLEVVGKKRVTESRSIDCPLSGYDRNALSMWLKTNAAEDGWQIDTYLGSQGSVKFIDGGCRLNYRVFKYIDAAMKGE